MERDDIVKYLILLISLVLLIYFLIAFPGGPFTFNEEAIIKYRSHSCDEEDGEKDYGNPLHKYPRDLMGF